MTISAELAPSTHIVGIELLQRPGSGDGLPLVLLHGVGSRARSFAPLMKALPAHVRAIAWNAPGYGTSKPLATAAPHPTDYSAVLLRLLDTLGMARIVLAGHSLGCLFAANFAARHPSRVARLALLSPTLGYRVAPGALLPPTVQARIDDLNALGPQAFAARRAARLVFEPERKQRVLAGVQQAMAALNPAGYAQAVQALGAGDLLADIAGTSAPTLVAVGTEDVVTPPANARAAYAALAHKAGYHEIADAGHALPQEQPATVAGLLLSLVEQADV